MQRVPLTNARLTRDDAHATRRISVADKTDSQFHSTLRCFEQKRGYQTSVKSSNTNARRWRQDKQRSMKGWSRTYPSSLTILENVPTRPALFPVSSWIRVLT